MGWRWRFPHAAVHQNVIVQMSYTSKSVMIAIGSDIGKSYRMESRLVESYT